jgi:hypothetical protein
MCQDTGMDWFLESVKLIGAVLGIATAAFIVFDRVFRNRPIFVLHAKVRAPNDNDLFLRVKNVLDEDIVIEKWGMSPAFVGLSKDDSFRAVFEAAIGNTPIAILPPLGELRLRLIILGAATGRENEPITISAQWNNTRRPWPFRRTLKIKTTVTRLHALKGAHVIL